MPNSRNRRAALPGRVGAKGGAMNGPAKVLVAGGGIGGLTAAIALRRAGFEVAVFERVSRL